MKTTYTNPILPGFADPDVLLHDGVYYMYATNTQMKDESELGFKVYSSEDLVHWEDRGMALKAEDSWGNKGFWAPDIVCVDGTFYLSYTVEEHICVATSDSPLGPFKQAEKKPIHEDIKEIDSHYFLDEDGTWYLYFCRFDNANQLWGAKLQPDMMHIQEDTLTRLLIPDTDWEREQWPVNEAPYMLKHKGLYYLTYSGSHCEAHYASGYAIAESPLGPFTKYEGNPFLKSNEHIKGTGHHCITTTPDGKELILIYHCHYNMGKPHPRKLCIDRLWFEEQENGPDVLKTNGPTWTEQTLEL